MKWVAGYHRYGWNIKRGYTYKIFDSCLLFVHLDRGNFLIAKPTENSPHMYQQTNKNFLFSTEGKNIAPTVSNSIISEQQ